jgi:predicted TIM-barrel enzyme
MARRKAHLGDRRLRSCVWAGHRLGGALPPELEALLPNRRYNDDLIAGLEDLRFSPSEREDAIAAVFAADPFLNVRLVSAALARAGIRRVANFPSVSQFGETFERSLAEVRLGVERELSILAQFRELGLLTYETITRDPSGAIDQTGRAGFLIGISFDDLPGISGRQDVARARKALVVSRVDADREVFICRPPVAANAAGDRTQIVIWPLD